MMRIIMWKMKCRRMKRWKPENQEIRTQRKGDEETRKPRKGDRKPERLGNFGKTIPTNAFKNNLV